jgi:outer membrane receptor for ferrienterochelin and colicins
MRSRIIYFLLAVVFFITTLSVHSQNTCGQATLDNAQLNYNIGRFNQVEEVLRNCLETGSFDGVEDFTKKEDAIRLLAMNAIAIDSLSIAELYVEQLIQHSPNYNERSKDPLKLKDLISAYNSQDFGIKVTSASKFEEKLKDAPASMFVITDKDIVNRGYLDFQQVLHDIPGFSFSKQDGLFRSNIYIRGYRSGNNDKFLLLIDGVEENDVSSDNAVINRQIPLSNIKQVEIIYGPASTMYGANAYAGVINVITKEEKDLFAGNSKFSGDIQTAYGSYNTMYIDGTINKKFKKGYLSLTGRKFHSSGRDLSTENYDYDYQTIDYLSLSSSENDQVFFENNVTAINSPYFSSNNGVISLTDIGANKMRELDNKMFDTIPKYSNPTDNWYLKMKLVMKNMDITIESYRTNLGATPSYVDGRSSGTNDINRWITWNTNLTFKYQANLSKKTLLTNTFSYRLHTIDGNTNLHFLSSYINGQRDFEDLYNDKDPSEVSIYYFRASNQIRDELKLFYQHSKKVGFISGVEFRSGVKQGDYSKGSFQNEYETAPDSTVNTVDGGNTSNVLDLGVFIQGKYKPTKNISIVLGSRLDYNQIKSTQGYGYNFAPRIALIYSREKFVVKGIYSQAFQDASFFAKYSTGVGRTNSPNLIPEEAQNFELAFQYDIKKRTIIELTNYLANYKNVVNELQDPLDLNKTQFQNNGKSQIYGSQVNLIHKLNKFDFWLNYTFTVPLSIEILDSNNNNILDTASYPRISDIPTHSINWGINFKVSKRLNINLRGNYVGERVSGENASGSYNTQKLFPSYLVLNSNINYCWNHFTFSFLVGNILDSRYYDPGWRQADETLYPSAHLQENRNFTFKLNYKF